MNCSFCGNKLNGNESYCPVCGQRVKRANGDFGTFSPSDVAPMPEFERSKKEAISLPLAKKRNKLAGCAYTFSAFALELGAIVIIFLAALFLDLFVQNEQLRETLLNYVAFGTQFVLIAYVLIFCKVNHLTPKDIGIRKPRNATVVILGVLLGFFGMFMANVPEMYFQEFLRSLGYNTAVGGAVDDLSTDGIFLYITFAIVAILPAVFEEILFRGIILENTKHLGTWQACLINGILFSLFHTNPMQTGYTFIMGMVWALIAIRANSIIPTMLIHLVSNGYSVVMLAIGTENLPPQFTSILLFCALTFTALGLWYFLKQDRYGQTKKTAPSRLFWLYALPGLAMNIFIWLYSFFSNVAEQVPPEEVIEVTAKIFSFINILH